MVDYYKKNMAEIEKSALYLYSNMDNGSFDKNNYELAITSSLAKNEELITIVRGLNFETRLNSAYNPRNEAEIWAKQYGESNSGCSQRTIVSFGLGNGYFIRELLKVIDDSESIIIYEPNLEMFLYTVKNFDITDIISNKNVFLVVEGINHMDFESVLWEYGYSVLFGQVTIVAIPEYENLYQEKLKWVLGVYQEVYISALISGNTASFNGKRWAEASIENIVPIIQNDCIEQYEGILKGKIPVILVASGPSLNKNIDILKTANGKALILAVDSAVKYLDKAGVRPDFIVTLDVKKSLSHFRNETAIRTPMFVSAEANPEVIKMNTAKKIFFGDDLNLRKWKGINKNAMSINGAGSVATATFEIARYLGAKTIILVGQDLAFDGEASHAMGEKRQEEISKEYVERIEGNSGELLRTRFDWFTYLCWYNEQVGTFDGKVINATEGGAKIRGTEILSLSKAIETYCTVEFNCEDVMCDGILKSENKDDQTLAAKCIEEFMLELNEVDESIQKALQLINRLLLDNEKNVIETYVMKKNSSLLSELNQSIAEKTVNLLLEKLTYDTTMSEYKDLFIRFKDQRKNREHVFQKTKKVYEAMDKASDFLKDKFNKCLEITDIY